MSQNIFVNNINSVKFKKYGRVLTEIECDDLISKADTISQVNSVAYFPSMQELEDSDNYNVLRDSLYGGMPIQIGCCYGKNNKLNALEYHRDSEINIAVTDFILLLGFIWDIEEDFTYDTRQVEAFLVPKNSVIEIYATTLHYAPCHVADTGFKSIVILPKGTNTEMDTDIKSISEDRLIVAKNKWLIAHKESGLEQTGAFIGLKGENITLSI